MRSFGDKLDAEAASRIGRVLNEKWTLEKLLGIGGMGSVYAGRHRNGARAAVKVLHGELAKNSEVRERFLREGYAANRVEHRGVVQVLDDDVVKEGPDEGAAYLVMELLEGESLEDRAARKPPFSEEEFLAVAEGVLEVLEAAHEHGVIHRDLKPDNIFLVHEAEHEGRLRVKVLDFGLARLAERERTTQFGLALGTPSYMSPEQASGQPNGIDGRTDIFALGATGFRLLALRRIHEEENPVRLVLKMSTEPAPPIRSVAPMVSAQVAAIIDRALQFHPDDRYPTATAMLADVQAAVQWRAAEQLRRAATPPADPPADAPQSKAPVDTTIALSASDLMSSSPDASAEISEAPTERRRRSMIAPVTAAFCGLLFFADRCSAESATRDAETMDAASSTPALVLPDAEVQAFEVELDAETTSDASFEGPVAIPASTRGPEEALSPPREYAGTLDAAEAVPDAVDEAAPPPPPPPRFQPLPPPTIAPRHVPTAPTPRKPVPPPRWPPPRRTH